MSLTRYLAELYQKAPNNTDNKLFSADTTIMTFTVGGERIILNEFNLQFLNAATDFSGNPPYPKARAGHIYVAAQAGEIGQVGGTIGTGKFLSEGDLLLCIKSGSTGDESTVGMNWIVIGNLGSGGITARAISQIDQSPLVAGMTYGEISGLVDGINTTFVVSKKNYIPGTLAFFYRGPVMFQKIDWQETDPAIGEFQTLFTPIAGSRLLAMYAYKGYRLGSFDDSFGDSMDG